MTGRLLRNLQLAGLAGKYKQQESERSGPFSCKKIGNRNFWKTCRKRLPYFWRSGDGDGKSTGSWSYILEGKLSFEVTALAVRYSARVEVSEIDCGPLCAPALYTPATAATAPQGRVPTPLRHRPSFAPT